LKFFLDLCVSNRNAWILYGYFLTGGLVAWSVWLSDMPTALLLVLMPLWGMTQNRRQAFSLWFGYYLVGSSVLPAASAVFFGEDAWLIIGYTMWVASAAILASPWSLLTFQKGYNRAFGLILATTLVAVPPIGIIGWLNPLSSAGWIMPGMGWSGIALWFLAAMVLIAGFEWSFRKNALITIAMVPALVAVLITLPKPLHWDVNGWPSGIYGWTAISTHLGKLPTDYGEFIDRQTKVISLVKAELNKPDTRVVILPEQIIGSWTHEMTEPIWLALLPLQSMKEKGQIVFIGGEIASGKQFDNALIAFSGDGVAYIHRSVQPVPVSMWNPFSPNGVVANWTHTNRGELHSILYTASICYEDVLVWPILHAFALPHNERPFAIISVANQWWIKGSGGDRIQQKSIESWAMLFTATLVRATND